MHIVKCRLWNKSFIHNFSYENIVSFLPSFTFADVSRDSYNFDNLNVVSSISIIFVCRIVSTSVRPSGCFWILVPPPFLPRFRLFVGICILFSLFFVVWEQKKVQIRISRYKIRTSCKVGRGGMLFDLWVAFLHLVNLLKTLTDDRQFQGSLKYEIADCTFG